MKPFLILQLRPEADASDDEFAAFLSKGGLQADEVQRLRLDCQTVPQDIDLTTYSGVIVGGGPGCISDPPEKKTAVETRIETAILALMPEITNRDIPFLGCCYGIGVLAHHLGAKVSKEKWGEPVGTTRCQLEPAGQLDPLLAGLPSEFAAFVGHKEAADDLPIGAVHLLSSRTCPYQMIRFGQNVYATQFHPEADAAGLETRINIYKNHGYFRPDEVSDLISMCRAAEVTIPQRILARFVARYRAA